MDRPPPNDEITRAELIAELEYLQANPNVRYGEWLRARLPALLTTLGTEADTCTNSTGEND